MSQSIEERYRPGRVETPRNGQDSRATGEGVSVSVGDILDEDINVSDGRCKKQTCRDSLKSEKAKKRGKEKIRKKDITIGTWNVRTMLPEGKLDLLLEELNDHKINITGLCETRWKGEGIFSKGDHAVVFSGNEKGGQRGVAIILDKFHAKCLRSHNAISDRIVAIKLNTKPAPLNIIQVYAPTSDCEEEEIESFYNDLQNVKNRIPSRELCIVMGDFNAKVGEGEDKECGIGPYGLGIRNDRGDMLATYCQANDLTVTNTLFNHPYRRRYTWISPGERHRNQIDYILIDTAWKSSVTNARTRPGVDCDSDHVLVTANVRMKAFKNDSGTCPVKYDLDKLEDEESKQQYAVETHNRFTVLLSDWRANESMPDEIWTDMSKAYKDIAAEKVGPKRNKPSKPYITDEVFQLAKDKSQARKNSNKEEYKRLKKEIRAKIRRDKVDWLARECSQITEANMERKSKKPFQQIKKVKNVSHVHVKTQSINAKDGTTLTEIEDILNRWHEYGQQLFDSIDVPEPCIKFEHMEPKPLLDEVKAALKQLKSGKSPGLDGIPAELLKNTGEAGVEALLHLCLKIWETCQWPREWKLQEFVMLHKGGSTKECGNYRTIALISHASKILLIIILNRMRKKAEEEISDCQAGYRTNRGTIDMLFSLQILIEKIRNSECEAYITFIDYSKAFDSVKHHRLFHHMVQMGFPRHLVALIAGLYEHQQATIRFGGGKCKFFDIKKGVRQGCILSPHLFNIYTEHIMRQADIESMGIKIGGRNIVELRYADDTCLIADNITSMRRIIYRVDDKGTEEGLGLNVIKTKVMPIKGKDSLPEELTNININGSVLEKVEHFKYLGSIKSADGTCLLDVLARIAMAKKKMNQLNNIWKDRNIPNYLKLSLLKCLIWPVVMYGCEAWTLRKQEEARLQAAEMWFYRHLLSVQWQDKKTNESVLEELSTSRGLLLEINKRRMKYIGHANRNPRTDLMATVLQGRIEGRRNRGRPPTSLMNNITASSGLSLSDVVHRSRDRQDWRAVVASTRAATFSRGDADR